MREFDVRLGSKAERGDTVTVWVDGEPLSAFAGETVSGVLLANGVAYGRQTVKKQHYRGYYCGMGICWECAMVINGVPDVRACTVVISEGMQIFTQIGFDGTKEA